jgi:hypothetical protein
LWAIEKTAEGTRVSYSIDLEPQGWLAQLLSNWMDFGRMHSRSMERPFELFIWLYFQWADKRLTPVQVALLQLLEQAATFLL